MRAARLLALLAGLLALPGCSAAPDPVPVSSAPAAAETPAARLPLWRIEPRPGISGTGYLLGSIHLGRERDMPLPRAINDAFDQAEVVVFELDLDQAMGDSMSVLQSAFFQDQRTLQGELSEETWARLVEQADSLPMPLPMLAKAKPWFVALALSIADLETGGFSAEAGLDLLLFERAKKAGKERVALETAAQQLAFFDGFSREEQEMFLRQALEESGDSTVQADEILTAWRAGDAEALDELFRAGLEEFPVLVDKLLVERNRRWLPRLEELLAEHPTVLVVVGAAHLVGEESLVELLEAAEYSVRQSVSEP